MVVAAYLEVFEMRTEKYAPEDYKNLVQNEIEEMWSLRAFPTFCGRHTVKNRRDSFRTVSIAMHISILHDEKWDF